MLREMHYTWQQVADALMVSRSTLWRRLTELGIPISTFSNISDTELDGVVELLHIKTSVQICHTTDNYKYKPLLQRGLY